MSDAGTKNHAAFVWSVADKLRGVYKQSDYGRVILPLVVCGGSTACSSRRRPTCSRATPRFRGKVENVAPVLESVAGEQFYNTSPLDFRRLLDDPANVAGNLRSYIAGFSPAARRRRQVRLRPADHQARRQGPAVPRRGAVRRGRSPTMRASSTTGSAPTTTSSGLRRRPRRCAWPADGGRQPVTLSA